MSSAICDRERAAANLRRLRLENVIERLFFGNEPRVLAQTREDLTSQFSSIKITSIGLPPRGFGRHRKGRQS
jgi:hypothetical protein